ncbi:MAG: hypothetical protein WCH65_05620 [bacterium]
MSVQSTVAAQSVSTAAIFLVSTFFLDILHAQIARNTVKTTGNSSGNIHMANVNHERIPLIRSPVILLYIRNITIHKLIAIINATVTIFFTSFCKNVFSFFISLIAFPIRHISVFIPIERTFATHCHCTSIVHEKRNG